jgi:autotransporter-associated beta strand protein
MLCKDGLPRFEVGDWLIRLFLALCIPLCGISHSVAVDTYWNSASGNWSTAANWTGGEPTGGHYAYLDNGGTATIAEAGEKCLFLYLGKTGSGSIEMINGDLAAYSAYIGEFHAGTFTQTGGSTTVSAVFRMGNYPGSTGNYYLGGTAQLSTSSEYLAYDGTAHFTQTGGTNTVNSLLYLGYESSSVGTYELSGTGQLSAGTESIGDKGTGTFTQTGGTNSASRLNVGYNSSSSSSTYKLSGTGQLSASSEYIAYDGQGSFEHTGGTNTIEQSLNVGYGSTSTGSYLLSDAGQLSAKRAEIGYRGTGTVTQTGGTNAVELTLSLGYNATGKGYYNLNGGQLSAAAEYLGTSGLSTFTQTGGVNSATHVKIGSYGSYVLCGGTLNLTGGLENSGAIDLSNSAAVINAASAIVDLSRASISNSQNMSLTVDEHSLLIVPTGFDAAAYFSDYHNAGTLHQAGSPLEIPSDSTIYGVGSIADRVDCRGTLSATSGSNYAINLKGGVRVFGTGSADLRDGTISVNDANSEMSGGTLAAKTLSIGSKGMGTFTHTAGTNLISSTVYVGYELGHAGNYSLSGSGQLSTATEIVGNYGTGIFTQTGGTNIVTTSLCLGSKSFSAGTYNLEGGTLVLKVLYKGSGTAAFNFGGGTLQASGDFTTSLPLTLTDNDGDAHIDTKDFAVTLSGALTGSGGLNKTGAGSLILKGPITYSGLTTISDGTLTIDNGLTNVMSVISGPGKLTVGSTTVLTAESINVGTLTIGSSSAHAAPEPAGFALLGMGILSGLVCARCQRIRTSVKN